jgi:hypothetical protein
MVRVLLAFALLSGCARSSTPAVEAPRPPAPSPRAQVMVLGVYHFDNPNQDVVKTDVDDHRSPRRQAELADVTARLARFRPTKILVEARDQAALSAAYEAYRSGAAPLSGDEIEQLGFRMARALGHDRVIAIDHPLDMDFDRVLAAARASTARVFLDTFEAAIAQFTALTKGQRDHTVRDNLRVLNDAALVAHGRDLYLVMTRVASGADAAGPEVVARWYERNFRIFASLAAQVTDPGDRVLVIYGSGHAGILRDVVAAQPDMVLVEPDAYLGD